MQAFFLHVLLSLGLPAIDSEFRWIGLFRYEKKGKIRDQSINSISKSLLNMYTMFSMKS